MDNKSWCDSTLGLFQDIIVTADHNSLINIIMLAYIHIIMTSLFQVDMVQIKLCYKDLFKKTCKEAIDDDTSGTYGDLLLALVGPGP